MKEIKFFDNQIGLSLTLSTGQYDMDEDEGELFYIGIFDDDDLCYQYDSFSEDVVIQIFNEIHNQVNLDNFYSEIFPRTCELYGLVKNH